MEFKADTDKAGLIKEYILNVLNGKFSKKLIDNCLIVDVLNEDSKIIEAIPKSKLPYLILVTKLEALINIFDTLQKDDNIVCIDEFKEDSNKFIESITRAIEISINEFDKKQIDDE
jgi:hypothetical protein